MLREFLRLFTDLSSLVEVLILSAFLFGLLSFLRGTRGEGMLKSLGFFLAVGFILLRGVAQEWQLQRLTLVLDAIFQASVIALVVIFQPELRRGLALKIGERWFQSVETDQNVLEEIANAAARLSKSKEGALIAIERTDGLKQYIQSGTVFDAAVKADLLANIFWPGAPLHDGAVIIQGGRISAAGCFLPLTDNPDISKMLGTRHRAALGLSEAEDALVVVVSEETGTISLAEGGRLHRDLDRESLLAMLADLSRPADDGEGELLGPGSDRDPPPSDPNLGGGGGMAGDSRGPGGMGGGRQTTRLTRKIVTDS